MTLSIDFLISTLLYELWIIDLEQALPSCLSPIFIVGVLSDGASIIPLEELPIIVSAYFNADKYTVWPKDSNK